MLKPEGGLKAEKKKNLKEMCLKGEQSIRNREPHSLTTERSRRGSKKEVSLPRTANPGPTCAAAQVLYYVLYIDLLRAGAEDADLR